MIARGEWYTTAKRKPWLRPLRAITLSDFFPLIGLLSKRKQGCYIFKLSKPVSSNVSPVGFFVAELVLANCAAGEDWFVLGSSPFSQFPHHSCSLKCHFIKAFKSQKSANDGFLRHPDIWDYGLSKNQINHVQQNIVELYKGWTHLEEPQVFTTCFQLLPYFSQFIFPLLMNM